MAACILCLSPSVGYGQDRFLANAAELTNYQLSNIRYVEKKLGIGKVLVFDFKRTRSGLGEEPIVFVQTKDEILMLSGNTGQALTTKESGTIAVETGINVTQRFKGDFAVWVAAKATWIAPHLYCKVSNTVSMGSAGSPSGRGWTNAERALFEKHIIKHTPAKSLPPNMIGFDSSIKDIVLGLPIKAAWGGNWDDAEIVGQDRRGYILVKYKNMTTEIIARPQEEKWLAVDPAILAKSISNPELFKPSIQLTRRGTFPIPVDTLVVPKDITLYRGTPVLVLLNQSRWAQAFVDRQISQDRYSIKFTTGRSSGEYDRTDLVITSKTLNRLNTLGSSLTLAAEYALFRNMIQKRLNLTSFWFHPNVSLPEKCQHVSDSTPLVPGAPLGAYYKGKWETVYVTEIVVDPYNLEQFVGVENKNIDKLPGYVLRSELIIQDITLRKLDENQVALQNRGIRKWADISGSFQINATFVSRDGSQVTLKREDGSEFTLLFSQLSLADRKIARLLDIYLQSEN
ncbi:MAG: hypothetical protein COA78_02865 [Blastopirellula sp.]|nr:MAG: hypothetical protein COA78_02865 [Blastopirellula sp.]